ncbi:hypothetical protein [Cryobacterium sp. GrIS_2_6]|uniref:hypothetical protein n=1 Tax=Cryobacterium sp. GrIS_2_6 TaxID=3162785 RepID=UPI002E0E8D81
MDVPAPAVSPRRLDAQAGHPHPLLVGCGDTAAGVELHDADGHDADGHDADGHDADERVHSLGCSGQFAGAVVHRVLEGRVGHGQGVESAVALDVECAETSGRDPCDAEDAPDGG